MALNVFISHSFLDKPIADKIRTELKQLDIHGYLAERDAQYGRLLPNKIAKAIDSSDVVLAVLTKNGSASASVNQEIGYAMKSNKPVVPLVESGVKAALFLQGKEVLEFSKEREDEAVERITKFIKERFKESLRENWVLLAFLLLAIVAFVIAINVRYSNSSYL